MRPVTSFWPGPEEGGRQRMRRRTVFFFPPKGIEGGKGAALKSGLRDDFRGRRLPRFSRFAGGPEFGREGIKGVCVPGWREGGRGRFPSELVE